MEKTIGMVVVAAFAASADGSPPTAAMAFRPAIFDHHILPFDVADLL
jgi:hypothetical protein